MIILQGSPLLARILYEQRRACSRADDKLTERISGSAFTSSR